VVALAAGLNRPETTAYRETLDVDGLGAIGFGLGLAYAWYSSPHNQLTHPHAHCADYQATMSTVAHAYAVERCGTGGPFGRLVTRIHAR
jgi:hypothetical protein